METQADIEQADYDINEVADTYTQTEEMCPVAHCRGKLMVYYTAWTEDDGLKHWKCNICDFDETE